MWYICGGENHIKKRRNTMKQFKVYYTRRTKSRYGAYDYKFSEIITAETDSEAKAVCKEMNKAPAGKRWAIIIRKVEEV